MGVSDNGDRACEIDSKGATAPKKGRHLQIVGGTRNYQIELCAGTSGGRLLCGNTRCLIGESLEYRTTDSYFNYYVRFIGKKRRRHQEDGLLQG